MRKRSTIDAYFKNISVLDSEVTAQSSVSNAEAPRKVQRSEPRETNIVPIERDPADQKSIWKYPVNERNEVVRKYLKDGPYRYMSDKYTSTDEKHPHSFCSSWFDMFPSWLEYSPKNDAIYCLVCYLTCKPTARDNPFVVGGFRNWKRVGGEDCSFHKHEGKYPNSSHKIALKACNDLMNSF